MNLQPVSNIILQNNSVMWSPLNQSPHYCKNRCQFAWSHSKAVCYSGCGPPYTSLVRSRVLTPPLYTFFYYYCLFGFPFISDSAVSMRIVAGVRCANYFFHDCLKLDPPYCQKDAPLPPSKKSADNCIMNNILRIYDAKNG